MEVKIQEMMDDEGYMDHKDDANGVALIHGFRIVAEVLVNVPCCYGTCRNCAPSSKDLLRLSGHPRILLFLFRCCCATFDHNTTAHRKLSRDRNNGYNAWAFRWLNAMLCHTHWCNYPQAAMDHLGVGLLHCALNMFNIHTWNNELKLLISPLCAQLGHLANALLSVYMVMDCTFRWEKRCKSKRCSVIDRCINYKSQVKKLDLIFYQVFASAMWSQQQNRGWKACSLWMIWYHMISGEVVHIISSPNIWTYCVTSLHSLGPSGFPMLIFWHFTIFFIIDYNDK